MMSDKSGQICFYCCLPFTVFTVWYSKYFGLQTLLHFKSFRYGQVPKIHVMSLNGEWQLPRSLKLTNSIIRGVPKKVSLNHIKSTSINSNTQGTKNFFQISECSNYWVIVKAAVGHQNGRKIRETAFWHFILAWLRKRSISEVYTAEEDGLCVLFYIHI